MNRKLKLQVQLSVDGFAAGPNGELDWMTWAWDDELKDYVSHLTDTVDTILLGRKMTDGFISHWTNALANPKSPEFDFAKLMVDYHKVVFTKTLDKSAWANTELAKGDLVDEVARIKNRNGKDIIVYGGATFVSNLISEKLIDEFHLFVNPAVIGSGMSIFSKLAEKQNLKLIKSKGFDCGITLINYQKQEVY